MLAKPLIRHSWRGPNYLGTQNAAEALSHKIADYWQSRGYEVDARVETTPTKIGPIFTVRSDLKNGLPIGAERLPEMEAA